MNQKQEAEAWMDKLCTDEADKQWNKMREQWEREEVKLLLKSKNAKIELMKQVYAEREKAILYKFHVKDVDRKELLEERRKLDFEIEEHYKKLELLKVEEEKRRKKHQDDLLYQIDHKKKIKDKEKQDDLYNERAAKLWEMELNKKLQDQKEIHKKRVSLLFLC